MDKETLRKVYLEKRMFLSDRDHRARSETIAAFFMDLPQLSKLRTLHTYLPIRSKREPDTEILVARLQEEYPALRIVISRTLAKGRLAHFQYEGPDQVEINKWGIPEPVHGEPVDPHTIDVVLIPLIAFDLYGHRIGYGKGYYDRFLKDIGSETLRLGYTVSVPLDVIPYTEEHDIPMDACVSPLGWYDFSGRISAG